MDKTLKNILIGTGFGVCLFVALTNLDVIFERAQLLIGLMQPIVIAGILAFVLNVPMMQIETWLKKSAAKMRGGKMAAAKTSGAIRTAAMLLTLLLVVLIFGLVIGIVVPQLMNSVVQAAQQLEIALPQLWQQLQDAWASSDLPGIGGLMSPDDFLASVNLPVTETQLIQAVQEWVGSFAASVVGTISLTAGKLVNLLMAVVFAIYFLLEKEMLARQATWLLRRFLPGAYPDKLLHAARRLRDTYAKFFSGQCMEAVLLGIMMFAAFTLCRLPYGGLVAVLTAVTSFIPYVGSFLSCAVAAVLILLTNPWLALLSVVVYQVVQFCENQFIYPRVVGSAVGLPPVYTILAVFIGGALFGLVGMIFFIPLMATIYSLVKELKQPPDAAA